jgi:hypothetical protein
LSRLFFCAMEKTKKDGLAKKSPKPVFVIPSMLKSKSFLERMIF